MYVLRFVTRNKHKLEEVRALVRSIAPEFDVEMLPVEKVEIQAESLEEIARFAADWLLARGYRNFFLEDAGLFIEALGGFPGPFSSYVYKKLGCRGILKLMSGVTNRRAYFKSVVALEFGGRIYLFTGIVRGTIAYEERGSHGFGFDPIFIPEGEIRTFAEMSTEEKNRYSHRARAVRAMIEFLRSRLTRRV